MRRIVDITIAPVLLVLAVVCWHLGVEDTVFSQDGVPEFVSRRFSGPWIGAATVCVVVAALLVLDVVRLTVRRRSHTR